MSQEDELMFSSIKKHWEEIKRKVQQVLSVSDVSYHLWLESLKLVGCRDNYVYIGCEKYDKRALEYLHKKFNLAFSVVINEKFGKVVTVVFRLKDSYDLRGYDYLKHYKCEINPDNTFDSFVVGECNKYAYLCSLAVAKDPAYTWNPLFIYGKTGLGKTHLLHSIGNYILKADSSKSVLYVTCKQYLEDVVDTLRSEYKDSLSIFKSKYLNADVLLIDDFQWIIGKEASLEEFFIIFDALREANKQIVIASDRIINVYGDIPE